MKVKEKSTKQCLKLRSLLIFLLCKKNRLNAKQKHLTSHLGANVWSKALLGATWFLILPQQGT